MAHQRTANTGLRRQETRIYGTETKAPKRPLMCNRHFVETKRPHELPPVRGYSQRAGKSLFAGDCVVGPVGLIFPLTGISWFSASSPELAGWLSEILSL